MIYSDDINKVCAVCVMAREGENGEMLCTLKSKTFPASTEACKKFRYDILKKKVRRMRRLKTDYKKEDFPL